MAYNDTLDEPMGFDEPNSVFCVGFANWVGGWEFDGSIRNVRIYDSVEIPEPATLTLLVLGGVALTLLRKRFRK